MRRAISTAGATPTLPKEAFRACEIMQTWRSFLVDIAEKKDANYDITAVSDGQPAYRHINWKMDCMDPTTLSVSKTNMRFNHYTTTPALDNVATNTSNADRFELPSNWISMANAYRDCRVEAVKVEHVLSFAPNNPSLFIAEFWSYDPIEPDRDYAALKQIPGIKFRYVNGTIPFVNQTASVVQADTSHNPNEVSAILGKNMVNPNKATIVRTSSFRSAKTFFEGDIKNRRFLALTDKETYTSQNAPSGKTYVPNYSEFGDDELFNHQWFYHMQIAVSDPAMGFPPINVRAMVKLTFYTSFKTLRAVRTNSLMTGRWLVNRTAISIEPNDDETALIDQDNLSASQSLWLAEHPKNRLPRRGVMYDHGQDIRNAWNLDPNDVEYEGGHPYLIKEVGTLTDPGGGGAEYWADTEMADGQDLIDGNTQFVEGEGEFADVPMLIDIRSDGSLMTHLPVGMATAELITYLQDHS